MKKTKWFIMLSIIVTIILQAGIMPVAASSVSTKATVVGASGDQSSSEEGIALISTSTKGDTKGSNAQAAFVSGVTATGTSSNTGSSLGSARVGYLHFDIADDMNAEDVGKAVVTINVTGTHGNLNGFKIRAGLYRVTAAPSSVKTTDATTYPAKGNDYAQSATAYCKEWIAADNLGAKTFDVTDMVKAAINDGDDGVSFRLQTVLSAFYFSIEGENIPTLRIDKLVKKIAGASGDQSASPAGTVLISTSTKGDTEGSDVQAVFEANVTATGTPAATGANLASARVGYLNFPIDNTMAPGAVGKATVSIYVTGVHGNIGSYKTKAGLYCVDTSWEDVTVSNASTYKAKNEDYSKEATIYSNEWIAKNEIGVKTFDVTDAVKDALTDGKGYVSFRLQTVLSGFIWKQKEKMLLPFRSRTVQQLIRSNPHMIFMRVSIR